MHRQKVWIFIFSILGLGSSSAAITYNSLSFQKSSDLTKDISDLLLKILKKLENHVKKEHFKNLLMNVVNLEISKSYISEIVFRNKINGQKEEKEQEKLMWEKNIKKIKDEIGEENSTNNRKIYEEIDLFSKLMEKFYKNSYELRNIVEKLEERKKVLFQEIIEFLEKIYAEKSDEILNYENLKSFWLEISNINEKILHRKFEKSEEGIDSLRQDIFNKQKIINKKLKSLKFINLWEKIKKLLDIQLEILKLLKEKIINNMKFEKSLEYIRKI